MAEQIADQVGDWNGQSGERWVANRPGSMQWWRFSARPRLKPPRPRRVSACWTLAAARARRVWRSQPASAQGGKCWAWDLSEPLIRRARALALAQPDTPALFQVADASSAELPEGAFDILFSRFGVMFFDDPIAAFAHMRRALRPGGRVAFVCWRSAVKNDWVRPPMGALTGIVPPSALPDPEARPVFVRRPGARGTHPDGG